jgi:hypothetical protein
MRNIPQASRATPGTPGIAGRLAASCAVVGLAVVGAPALAFADEPAGAYDVKFEQVSTNCEHPLAYPQHGSIKIDVKGSELKVDIDRTPLMVGKPTKAGAVHKVSARSPKPGHTPIEGMDGAFSVEGRITGEGMLSLFLVGEYQTAGKPLCTQSWNLTGLRARADKPDKADKPKK